MTVRLSPSRATVKRPRAYHPTVFWFVGGIDPEVIAEATRSGRPVPVNHSPQFAPVIEPTLTTGVNALALAALTWLATSESP